MQFFRCCVCECQISIIIVLMCFQVKDFVSCKCSVVQFSLLTSRKSCYNFPPIKQASRLAVTLLFLSNLPANSLISATFLSVGMTVIVSEFISKPKKTELLARFKFGFLRVNNNPQIRQYFYCVMHRMHYLIIRLYFY